MASFFKKPSWAQARAPTTQPEFYRRQRYTDITAIGSDDSSSDSDIKPKTSIVYKESDEKKGKRRRISPDDDDDEKASMEEQPQPQPEPEPEPEAPVELVDSPSGSDLCEVKPVTRPSQAAAAPAVTAPVTPSRRERGAKYSPRARRAYSRSPVKRRGSQNAIRVDSESPPAQSPPSSKPINLEDSENDGDDETDDEYAELARQARARVQQRSQSAQRQSASKTRSPPNGVHKSPTKSQNRSPRSSNENGTRATPATNDPVMSILITSELEDTTPLIVHRKLCQNLGEVRKTWCKRQKFSEDVSSSVFLTWRGRRVFDVTTCRSLGIGDVEESLFASTQGFFAREGMSGILMEAITAEKFEEQKRRAAMNLAREEEEEEEDDEVENERPGQLLQLILKSADMEELQVRVKATVELNQVVAHFRKMRKIAPEKSVILLFDGDRLDLNSLVQDTELDDLDCVDVLIK